MTARPSPLRFAAFALLAAALGCGKRGAPLPPIRPVPAAPTAVAVRRVGDQIVVRFTVPTANTDKSEPPAISRIDIYAAPGPPTTPPPVSLPAAAGWLPPPATHPLSIGGLPHVLLTPPAGTDRTRRRAIPAATTAAQIMVRKYLRGHVDVRLVPPPGATAPSSTTQPAAADSRPAPGDEATFADAMTKARAAAAASPDVSVMRYLVVGVAGGNRLGTPSAVLELPLLTDLSAPTGLALTYDEKTTTLVWATTAPAQRFRVYRTDADGHELGGPLNPTPLVPTPSPPANLPVASGWIPPPVTRPLPLGELPHLLPAPPMTAQYALPTVFGTEQCFVVRTAAVLGPVSIESDATKPVCVTPVDTFPPPPPSGLAALPSPGRITLVWTVVDAPDFAGYLVLRRDAPTGAFAPLVAAPIVETQYTDATPKAGASYTYEVVAVDRAGNRSSPSNQVDQVGR